MLLLFVISHPFVVDVACTPLRSTNKHVTEQLLRVEDDMSKCLPFLSMFSLHALYVTLGETFVIYLFLC